MLRVAKFIVVSLLALFVVLLFVTDNPEPTVDQVGTMYKVDSPNGMYTACIVVYGASYGTQTCAAVASKAGGEPYKWIYALEWPWLDDIAYHSVQWESDGVVVVTCTPIKQDLPGEAIVQPFGIRVVYRRKS